MQLSRQASGARRAASHVCYHWQFVGFIVPAAVVQERLDLMVQPLLFLVSVRREAHNLRCDVDPRDRGQRPPTGNGIHFQ